MMTSSKKSEEVYLTLLKVYNYLSILEKIYIIIFL